MALVKPLDVMILAILSSKVAHIMYFINHWNPLLMFWKVDVMIMVSEPGKSGTSSLTLFLFAIVFNLRTGIKASRFLNVNNITRGLNWKKPFELVRC
jgi:hypothetical protein